MNPLVDMFFVDKHIGFLIGIVWHLDLEVPMKFMCIIYFHGF